MEKLTGTVLLVLATVLVLISIHPIEACRFMKEDQKLVINKDDLSLLSSLQKHRDPPSAPNPRIPSLTDGRAFAGHAMPPRAETEPQGSFSA